MGVAIGTLWAGVRKDAGGSFERPTVNLRSSDSPTRYEIPPAMPAASRSLAGVLPLIPGFSRHDGLFRGVSNDPA